MIFGNLVLEDAEGAVLAHSVTTVDGRLPKGHILSAADIIILQAAGLTSVIAASLEPGDLLEDEAASRIGAAIDGTDLRFSHATTGRVNIFSTANGLFTVSKTIVDRLNRIDPAITLATLADHVSVRSGDMVATIKIIPLAVSLQAVRAALDVLVEETVFAVKRFMALRVALIATELPSLKVSVMDKTRKLLDQRLEVSGSHVARELRVPHRADAVAEAIGCVVDDHELIVVFGASAVSDPRDVIPQAIRMSDGVVERVGLPVDPGNLLVLGRIGAVPVIGAPGCARSPRENGFDWVLARILAGEHPAQDALSGFGVGGLLMEIPTRPRPRALADGMAQKIRLGVIILAAGQASRMSGSGQHKLLAEFDGVPLVRQSVVTVLGSQADEVVLVTGYRSADILAALAGLSVPAVQNPDYHEGMASSLKAGLSVLRDKVDGVVMFLADMPGVTTADLDRMIEAFHRHEGKAIIRAMAYGKRGNPVILPSATFEAIAKLEGDIGARPIIEKSGLVTIDIDIGDAAHLDVDTLEAIIAAGGVLKG